MRILIYSSCELSSELMMTRRLFVGLGGSDIYRTVKESHYEMLIIRGAVEQWRGAEAGVRRVLPKGYRRFIEAQKSTIVWHKPMSELDAQTWVAPVTVERWCPRLMDGPNLSYPGARKNSKIPTPRGQYFA